MTPTSGPAERPDWLPADVYPFALRTIPLSSSEVHYVDEGTGPSVLFVHAGMWSFVFRDVITRLRDDFRCVSLDFPGFGLAPAPDDDTEGPALAGLSDVLSEFVVALDLGDAVVVAHDLGGPVALGFAADHSERVSGLVLSNTFAWPPERRALRAMLRLMSSPPITGLGVATNLVPRLTATRFGLGRHLDAADRRAFRGPFRDRSRRRRFHRLMGSALRNRDHMERIERAATGPLNYLPVLSIFGERNDPFGFQRRIAATFPDHEGVVVEKGNHFPMADDPDLFADAVRDWWSRRVAGLPSMAM